MFSSIYLPGDQLLGKLFQVVEARSSAVYTKSTRGDGKKSVWVSLLVTGPGINDHLNHAKLHNILSPLSPQGIVPVPALDLPVSGDTTDANNPLVRDTKVRDKKTWLSRGVNLFVGKQQYNECCLSGLGSAGDADGMDNHVVYLRNLRT